MSNAPQPALATFEGRVVLVTGGTKGIGRAIAEGFLGAGATVVVCARTEPDSLPHSNGRRAIFMQCDVRTAQACKELVDRVGEEHGRIDVLVNNAGGSPHVDAATVSPRFSDAIVNLNAVGAFIWERFDGRTTGEAIVAALVEAFDVDEERARTDYLTFVAQLQGLEALDLAGSGRG